MNNLRLKNFFFLVCHAELNAILNKNSADVKNCTIYVGLFPCNECAKVIIQSGIKTVLYMSDKHANKISTKAAKLMFDAAKIEYRYLVLLYYLCLFFKHYYLSLFFKYK